LFPARQRDERRLPLVCIRDVVGYVKIRLEDGHPVQRAVRVVDGGERRLDVDHRAVALPALVILVAVDGLDLVHAVLAV
jgi:hypothetical protein